jgi:hypothetical protein
MKIVQIYRDGKMDDIDCPTLNLKNICSNLTQLSKSRGNDSIKLLYQWKYDGNELLCYGWYEGEAGFENKHDLPPAGNSKFLETDSSEQLLFGDIFIAKKNKKFIPFDVSGYGEFYNFAFEGFDECGTDEESLDTEIEDDDCVPVDEEDEEEDANIEYNGDSELDEDTNEY